MADSVSDTSASPAGSSKRSRVAKSVSRNAQAVLSKGIVYFLSHRSLWRPFLSCLPQYLALYVSVVVGMFSFTYVPQLAVLFFVDGPLAVGTAILLVLNESVTVVNALARQYLLRDALVNTFDGTLLTRNKTGMVQEGREVKFGGGLDPIQKLGKLVKSPFDGFGVKSLLRYFLYLPLNFIPVVGTAAFFFFQARSRGGTVHDRFFQLKKWAPSQRVDWLETHKGPYTAFGIVAGLLEMIPVASVFFTYTNTVGAALWAADIDAVDAPHDAPVNAPVPIIDDTQDTGVTGGEQ
ncbi:Pfam:DUF540 [Geosmithia morbida]|uniref:Pfam:DUF540 n=1 Tax=Geosmithia morbida TaxID=1094350 RepID=A0A9P4YZ31_9HYPO|nr:Pfam:DUF540 [Geosmithia morbida]KAF4124675.1 Pfam:DUF540 [Geosmithia morbida]